MSSSPVLVAVGLVQQMLRFDARPIAARRLQPMPDLRRVQSAVPVAVPEAPELLPLHRQPRRLRDPRLGRVQIGDVLLQLDEAVPIFVHVLYCLHGDDVVHVGEVVGVQEGAQLLRARRHIPVAVGGAEAALIAGRHAGVALRIRVRTQRGVGRSVRLIAVFVPPHRPVAVAVVAPQRRFEALLPGAPPGPFDPRPQLRLRHRRVAVRIDQPHQ